MAHVAQAVRRERLVDAAIAVMVRDGVGAATTRAIVAEADMPLGAFHYCFTSKQELLGEVIETILGHTLDQALTEVAGEGSVEERLRRGVGSYWKHVVEQPGEHRLSYELGQYAARHPELAQLSVRQYQAYLTGLTQLLGALTDEHGEPVEWQAPLPALARYITGVLDGVTLLFLNEGDAAAARAALDLVVDHVASLASAT